MCRNGGRGGVGRFLRVGQEVLSITAGWRSPGDKETWWWNDTVQQVIKANKGKGRCGKHQEGRQAEIATDRKTGRQRKQ